MRRSQKIKPAVQKNRWNGEEIKDEKRERKGRRRGEKKKNQILMPTPWCHLVLSRHQIELRSTK